MLLLLASLSIVLSAVAISWHLATQREREAELLFIGGEFQRAIASYYDALPANRQFPPSLDALLRDPRFPGVRRHLRRLYVDPMTGRDEWGLVKAPGGAITAVYSLSGTAPIKRANFPPEFAGFEGAASYADWKFAAGKK